MQYLEFRENQSAGGMRMRDPLDVQEEGLLDE
jgi:hypothetical protein